MEILIGMIVIFVLLLILGVNIQMLLVFAQWAAVLFVLAVWLYYVVNLVLWLLGKPCKGNFLYVEQMGMMHFAVVYDVDGTEYKNYFFMETKHGHVFDDKKVYKLRVLQFGGLSLAIDSYCLKESIIIVFLIGAVLAWLVKQMLTLTALVF